MVYTQSKAIASRSMATQMELPQKHTAVHVSGCRECLSLVSVLEGSRDDIWDQVNNLLCLVAEYKDEVKGLKTIRECERNRLVESHPSIPERNAADGSSARVGGALTLLPSGRGRPKSQG